LAAEDAKGAIDVHTHYLAEALVSAMSSRAERPRISGSGADRVIEYGAGNVHPLEPAMTDLELQRREMAAAGVGRAVLTVNLPGVDWFDPVDGVAIARDVNDELAQIVRDDPARTSALAVLPMQVPEEAAAELERAAGLGLSGAMIYSNVAGEPLDPAALRDLLDCAARLDLPLTVHPTYPLSAATLDAYALIPTLGFLVDTTAAVLRLILGGAYEGREELKLVLCHAGSLLPQIAGRVDYEAERHGEKGLGALTGTALPSERIGLLYTDAVCNSPGALRSTLDLLGPERVMFGSDYPFWEHDRTHLAIADAGLSDDSVAMIRAGNAERLFGPFAAA
jgi:predicted TIM-barrel fold metal-dependent hydrolase